MTSAMASKPGFSCYMPSRKGIRPSYNVAHRLRMREICGNLHPTKTSYPVCRSLFGKVPGRLGIPLKDIVDSTVLHEEGHVFLGFNKDGQFVLSYTLNVEADDHTAFPIYVYRLHWWKFNNAQPMDRVSEVRLFGEEEIQQDLYIAVCSWPTDQSKIMVYGCCATNTYDFDEEKLQCYLTITAIPSVHPCQQCIFHKYSNQDQLDFDPAWLMFEDIIPSPPTPPKCLQHGFAVHTKYELSPPYPSLSPKHSLAKDGLVVLNTGDALIALSVKLGEFGNGGSFYSPLVSGSASFASFSSKHSSIRTDSQSQGFSNSPASLNKMKFSPYVKGQEPGNSQELQKESSSDIKDVSTQTSTAYEDVEFWCYATSIEDCPYMDDLKRTLTPSKTSKLCFNGRRCHCSANVDNSASLDSKKENANPQSEDSHFAWIDNLEDEGSPRNTCAHSHPADETCTGDDTFDISPSSSPDTSRTCKLFNKVEFTKTRMDKASNTPDEFYCCKIHQNYDTKNLNKCTNKETATKNVKLKQVRDTSLSDGLSKHSGLNNDILAKCKFSSDSQNKKHDDKKPFSSSLNTPPTPKNAFFHEDVRLQSNVHQPLLGDFNLGIGSEIRHHCPVHNMVDTNSSSQMTIRECTCQLQGFTYSVRRFVERTPGEELLGPIEAYDYHSMLPMSVLGDRQAPMILTNRTARSEGACIDVKQLTMDAEHYICDAIRIHATWAHRFIAFTDYDMQILDVCPDSCSVLVMIMALIRARPVPKQPQNVFEFVDEPFSEYPCLYQTGFKFAWNLRTGRCKTLDIEDLQEFDQAKLKKTWNPGRALCQRIQRQWSVPQSHSKGVHVLTNEAVFKNRSLTKLIDPVHYMTIVLT